MSTPNPGSPSAQDLGCVCPIGENNCGKGVEGKFHLHPECPVHRVELDPCPRCGELVTDDMGHDCKPKYIPAGWGAHARRAEAVAFGKYIMERLSDDFAEHCQGDEAASAWVDAAWSDVPALYAEFKESQGG